LRLTDVGKQRKKTFLPDKLVPTETSCWHTEKTSFDYGFNVLTKSADINNSVPSTSKPMESYSKDPNNNEILYNSSINNNISALLKKLYNRHEWSSLVFEWCQTSSPGKREWSRFKAMFFTISFGGGGWVLWAKWN
jgi:hypothetical protein